MYKISKMVWASKTAIAKITAKITATIETGAVFQVPIIY